MLVPQQSLVALPWLFVTVIKNQSRFIFKRIGFQFVRHFPKSVFDESSLQLWLFALGPRAKNFFDDSYWIALGVIGEGVSDCLRERAELCPRRPTEEMLQ